MALVRGEDPFRVFKMLMDEAGKKSSLKTSISKMTDPQRKTFVEELEKGGRFMRPNTLRDYRFKYEERKDYVPFSAQGERLSVLTDFINEGSWEAYYKKHGKGEKAPPPWSCYASAHPFELILDAKERLKNLATEKVKHLQIKDDDASLLHDLAVCYLGMGYPVRAIPLLSKSAEISPFHAFTHFWRAIALLGGKQPFRHSWHAIEEMLHHLSLAEDLQTTPSFQHVRRLIYLDFHDRIGYERPEAPKPEVAPEEGLLWILGQCSLLTIDELKTILL